MSITRNQLLAIGFSLSVAVSSAAMAQAASAPTTASAATPPATGGTPASGSPAATTTKIGVINIQEAILATEEGKKDFDALQQRFTPKQAELKNLNDDVENLKKQYQAQADKLSDEEKNT